MRGLVLLGSESPIESVDKLSGNIDNTSLNFYMENDDSQDDSNINTSSAGSSNSNSNSKSSRAYNSKKKVNGKKYRVDKNNDDDDEDDDEDEDGYIYTKRPAGISADHILMVHSRFDRVISRLQIEQLSDKWGGKYKKKV